MVKKTPPAYGKNTGEHYFFYHSFNCIFECEYCYLQGYFSSPDIVLYVNHEEICAEITAICKKAPKRQHWFHGGEFSDSLALSHLTQELPVYWSTFSNLPNAKLELRTKICRHSSGVAFAAACQYRKLVQSLPTGESSQIRTQDIASVFALAGDCALSGSNYQLAVHLDPIIYSEQLETEYQHLLTALRARAPSLAYLSLGVVRFSKDVFRQVKKNYPQSKLFAESFCARTDKKVSYQQRCGSMFYKKSTTSVLRQASLTTASTTVWNSYASRLLEQPRGAFRDVCCFTMKHYSRAISVPKTVLKYFYAVRR